MTCDARVPRAPGAHDNQPNLNAHRCTKTAKHTVLVRQQLHALCGTHYNQWKREQWIAIWDG